MEGIRAIDNMRQCHLGLALEYILYSRSFMFDSLEVHIQPNNEVTVFKTNTRISEAFLHTPVPKISL